MLRFFNQIRFYPVTSDELRRNRGEFLTGRFRLRVEEETFRLSDCQRFLASNADSIETFRAQQRAVFAEERERWVSAWQNVAEAEPQAGIAAGEIELPAGGRLISAHLPSSVWQVVPKEGETVAEGDRLVIIESMKMEIAITAPAADRIERILVVPGKTVEAGHALAVLVEG